MTGGYFTRTYEVWRYTEGHDPAGQPIETWEKLADVPGRAYLGRMNNVFGQDGLAGSGNVYWTFATPSDTDITRSDQVRFDGRQLEVQAVSVTSRGDRIEALCREVQP